MFLTSNPSEEISPKQIILWTLKDLLGFLINITLQ